ncbi:hypothetical protein DFH09DRAFT_1084420 [Mycena vulgaris]|nr:hypothetical protein DFH09DRAFT_1084420 [Mycena vulgaris]
MSGSGATYYNEELKELLQLLKHLPDTNPLGDNYNFIGYVPDPEKVVDTGLLMHLGKCLATIRHANWRKSLVSDLGDPTTRSLFTSENPLDIARDSYDMGLGLFEAGAEPLGGCVSKL